jgi:vacuolar-type H+-ATPase subunit I/STV1
MNTAIKDLKPFVPVLEAMKRDSGLVDHVRDYLKSGGAPNKSIQERLNLSEDFEYDANEAVTDPNSDSAKLQQAHIDTVVQQRVNQVLAREKKTATQMQKQMLMKKQQEDFKKRYNMTEEQFANFKQAAAKKTMTLDDAYYILNKEKAAANVANNTKTDMLNQMKNVRNIPTTASDSNNQGTSQKNPNDSVFDAMVGSDNDVDNLFG